MEPKVRKFGDFIGDLFLHPDGHAWQQLMVFCICTAGTYGFFLVVLCQCAIFWGELSKGRINKAKKSCEHLVFVGVYGVYCTLKIFYQPSGPYDRWCNHAMSLNLSLSHDGLKKPENSLLTKLTSSDLHRSVPYTPEGWFAAAYRWTINDGVFLAEKSFDFCRCQDHSLDGDIRGYYGICMSKDMMYQYMIYGQALYGDMGDDNDWMIDLYPISLVVSNMFDFHTGP